MHRSKNISCALYSRRQRATDESPQNVDTTISVCSTLGGPPLATDDMCQLLTTSFSISAHSSLVASFQSRATPALGGSCRNGGRQHWRAYCRLYKYTP